MNNHENTPTPKGISIEGFWQQLKDKTGQITNTTQITDKTVQINTVNAYSEADGKDSQDLPGASEDWVARFDDWLSRL